MEQFTHMAPVGKSVGDIFNNKEFRAEVNGKTQQAGMKILDKWLNDAVRGTAEDTVTWAGKVSLMLRQKGILYALTGNLPSVLRQFNSIPHGMAVDPALAGEMTRQMIKSVNPKHFNSIMAETNAKSKMMKTRNFDRIQVAINRQESSKQAMKRKKSYSNKALSWQRFADRRTVSSR